KVEQGLLPSLSGMGTNALGIETLCDDAASGVERERQSIPPGGRRSPNVNSPFTAHHPIEIVDHRAIPGELCRPPSDEAHSTDPRFLCFRDCSPFPPDAT